jgi:dephospho-CoA kinase
MLRPTQRMWNDMRLIGLTGGIGMGKSTASAAFRRAHLPVFDADAEVHKLQAKGGAALPAIAAAFPGTVTDGVLNRAALREIVLADKNELRKLERILHPRVRRAEQKFLARARSAGARVAILDIPLLFEGRGDKRVDEVVVVSAPRDVQIARVRARGKMSPAQIASVIARQMPDAEKRRRADHVIRTGLSRFHALRSLKRLMMEWRA